MFWNEIVGAVFLLIGAFFCFVGALGVVRMPDVYNKLQAGTKATTLGFLSLAVGAGWMQPEWALRLLLLAVFVVITNPIGSHSLARAAWRSGVPVETASKNSDTTNLKRGKR